jgi:hypothetical protein
VNSGEFPRNFVNLAALYYFKENRMPFIILRKNYEKGCTGYEKGCTLIWHDMMLSITKAEFLPAYT